MRAFLLGILFALILIPTAVYFYVKLGYVSLATTAPTLPFEERMAHMALRTSVEESKELKNPIRPSEDNMLAGVKDYRENCAVCHGIPGQPKTQMAAGMFPPPPQLFEHKEMVTDDPEGSTFWKISNGIRLSGMPRFDKLSESSRWQMTLVLKNADKLPLNVQANLRLPLDGPK